MLKGKSQLCEICQASDDLAHIDEIGPMWSRALVDFEGLGSNDGEGNIIKLMQELIVPQSKRTQETEGELGHLEGSLQLYNYLVKALRERALSHVSFKQEFKVLQSVMGSLKFMNKDQIYTAFRTTSRTTESMDERSRGRLVQQSYLEPHQYKTDATPAEIINMMRYAKSHHHLEPFANIPRPAPLWLHTMLTKPPFGRPPIFDKADYANYRRDMNTNIQ